MIYGDLTLRDRLLRAAVGAILGGCAGFLFALGEYCPKGPLIRGVLIPFVPAAAVGAAIGAWLAFRVKKIA